MKKIYLLTVILFLFACMTTSQAATIDPEIAKKISKTVFEVVVKKDQDSQIVYEKELPLDLIPYQERVDQYHSIGSCFLLGENRFATAAHVFHIHGYSKPKELYVRNQAGDVFPVKNIIKYASDKDYAMFSVEGFTNTDFLVENREAQLNSVVYAVGNALGEGIVVRNGLFTSETFEQQDGKWKWIRFSAAASPGNSGGPLLDEKGRVIGVVIGKSENENLNYAVPISLVMDDSGEKAFLIQRDNFELLTWSESTVQKIEKTYPLPAEIQALAVQMNKDYFDHYEKGFTKLKKTYKNRLFPNGSESDLLLANSSFNAELPKMILQDTGNNWRFYPSEKSEFETVQLEDNGVVSSFTYTNLWVGHIRFPDNVSVFDMSQDSTQFGKVLLKGLPLYRYVGDTQIKISELGPSKTQEIVADDYGRKWYLYTWDMDFSSEIIMSFVHYTPRGATVLVVNVPSAYEMLRYDVYQLTNFVIQDYSGTVDQFSQFLDGEFSPEFLKHIKIETGKDMSIDTQYYKVVLPKSLFSPENTSDLSFETAFVREDKQGIMQAFNFKIRPSEQEPIFYGVTLHLEPKGRVPSEAKIRWKQLKDKKGVFDGDLFYIQGTVMGQKIMDGKLKQLDRDSAFGVIAAVDDRDQRSAVLKALHNLKKRFKLKP